MRPKPKQFLLPAIIFLAIVLVALAVRLWPRTIPFDQCSDVYKRYAAVDGVVATFIKDYKVNDTVFVDVTLLEATDSVSWTTLKKDFDVPDPSPDFQQFIDSGEDLIIGGRFRENLMRQPALRQLCRNADIRYTNMGNSTAKKGQKSSTQTQFSITCKEEGRITR